MRFFSTITVIVFACGEAAGQGYRADKAASKMTLPDGFKIELVASEPLVRQPVAIDFDERGRLWVMQYLQYPNPAGLKRVKVDRYSRTAYDRVPEPPPRGPKGADRLTILEPDPDRPGQLKAKDFVAGLNLASGFAFGHGGVFVLQVPYLLFYPDRNRDDVPDGDPDVLLSGFGMEDAHSVANSLTWGPDGWLYGCQGSTVSANIRGIEFQQGVWRYHPITRKFELFCEGGGNSWGLDFDRHGQLLYSTNHGGFVMLHGVQGGYYWKSFGKHGALHNPHAYGYFDHVPHQDFRGGHVTVGGIVYRGDNFPAKFRDHYIGADLLGHAVRWSEIEPNGSTFKSRNGGELLLANDTWFAPSDVCLGPDGCVYVADWHDPRTAHPDPDAEWDRSNGRIYRIAHGAAPKVGDIDLNTKSTSDLLKLLDHTNDWYARTARRILADRRDPEAILPLRSRVRLGKDDSVLQALWALYISGGFNESFGRELLSHPNEHARSWAVRFLGDEVRISQDTGHNLVELATKEQSSTVRSQLACSARQLPANQAIPIVLALCGRDDDSGDRYIPLLLWWAVEKYAIESRAIVIQAFSTSKAWSCKINREIVIPKLVRRYAAEGTISGDQSCERLIRSIPDAERTPIWQSLDDGLNERPPNNEIDDKLTALVREYAARNPTDYQLTSLGARFGDHEATHRLLGWGFDRKRSVEGRAAAVRAYAKFGPKVGANDLLKLAMSNEPEVVRLAALDGWAKWGTDESAKLLIDHYARTGPVFRARLRSVLLSRKSWAEVLIRAVEGKRVPADDFTPQELFHVAEFDDRDLNARIRKIWGNLRSATPEEKLAEVRRLNNDLRAAAGDPASGRVLYTKHCAACHKLHDEGGAIGPDLTHANRSDRDYLLVSLIDPSSVIRKEYMSYIVETKSNQLITGVITKQEAGTLTIANAKAEITTLQRDDIVSLRESSMSLMPEGLLTILKPQELRDLFAYLQTPKVKP